MQWQPYDIMISSPIFRLIPLSGLPKNSYHGFHIHQFGTIGASCTQSGGHYNPFTENHGAPYAGTRHVGDLGNILSDDNGNFGNTSISASIFSEAIVSHGCLD